MKRKPFILITNDDGITAPGLAVLYQSMMRLGEVAVVAPDREMSAAGHAITLSKPLRANEVKLEGGVVGHAVNGTPADCVKIAVKALLDREPDLVVSGINLGSNTGINVIYSGTVSAATEGVILGIPSIAFSLATWEQPDFRASGKIATLLAREILQQSLPANTLLNVNIPPLPMEEIKGIRVTKQGKAIFDEQFDKRLDPRSRPYYWMTGTRLPEEEEDGSDDRMVQEGYVSVTPIQYDLTHYNFLESLRKWPIFSNGKIELRKVS